MIKARPFHECCTITGFFGVLFSNAERPKRHVSKSVARSVNCIGKCFHYISFKLALTMRGNVE